MKIEFKSYNNIYSLLRSILFLIIGAIMFTNPDAVIIIISYVLGGIIIIFGIYNCIKNYVELKKDNSTSSKDMVVGITSIVIGLIFIFLAGVIETIFRFLIGAWILFSGINRLIQTLELSSKNKNFIVQLVISVALIISGLYTILKANLAFQAIGIILITYSALEILGYIFNKTTSNSNYNKVKETSIIKDANIIEDKTINKKKEKKTKKEKNSD